MGSFGVLTPILRNIGCGQHIFTERLAETAPRYPRRTGRLSVALEQITQALGGSRLAQQLGILTSDSTLLRQLRRRAFVDCARAPRVLGIDDWAWRKAHRYGTILCDLERGKVIDLVGPATAIKFGPLGRHRLGFEDGATEA